MKIPLVFMSLLLLPACGGDGDVPTAEQNAQIEEAANLLNQAPADLDNIDDSGLAPTNGVANETP